MSSKPLSFAMMHGVQRSTQPEGVVVFFTLTIDIRRKGLDVTARSLMQCSHCHELRGEVQQGLFALQTHKALVLLLTFWCYACFHASRKPLSVVKSVLTGERTMGRRPSGLPMLQDPLIHVCSSVFPS